MALPVVVAREVPQFTLISQYAVSRLGLMPTVTIRQRECVYMVDTAVTIESASDLDGDSKYEVLVLPELGGRSDLVGRLLAWPDSTEIGTITAAQDVDGKAQVTLADGLSTSPTGKSGALVAIGVYGTPAYVATPAGHSWENILAGEEAMAYLGARLEAAYVAAVTEILPQLGITTITADQITMAVRALAAQSINYESFLAEQGEKVELDRRAKTIPWLQVSGNVPSAT